MQPRQSRRQMLTTVKRREHPQPPRYLPRPLPAGQPKWPKGPNSDQVRPMIPTPSRMQHGIEVLAPSRRNRQIVPRFHRTLPTTVIARARAPGVTDGTAQVPFPSIENAELHGACTAQPGRTVPDPLENQIPERRRKPVVRSHHPSQCRLKGAQPNPARHVRKSRAHTHQHRSDRRDQTSPPSQNQTAATILGRHNSHRRHRRYRYHRRLNRRTKRHLTRTLTWTCHHRHRTALIEAPEQSSAHYQAPNPSTHPQAHSPDAAAPGAAAPAWPAPSRHPA